MKNQFLKRFKLNALGNGYNQIVTLLIQLVLIPIYLKSWDKNLYADWLVITSIPTVFFLLDSGISQASANRASMSAGSGDWLTVAKILQTAFVYTMLASGVIVIMAIFLNEFVDWGQVLKLRVISTNDAKIIFYAMVVNLTIQLTGGFVEAWYRAIDRTALGYFFLANRRMVDFVITLLVLLLSKNPVILAISLVSGQFLMLAVLIKVAHSFSPKSIIGINKASMSEFRKVLKPALAYLCFPVSQIITIEGGVQMVNQLASASLLVGFTMSRTMMRLVLQLGQVTSNALRPEISRLCGAGELNLAILETKKIVKIVVVVCLIIYFAEVYFGPEIILLWSNGKVQVTRMSLLFIGCHAILNVFWYVAAAIIVATNRHVKIALVYAITSGLVLSVWIVLRNVIPPVIGASILLAMPELILVIYLLVIYKNLPRVHTI